MQQGAGMTSAGQNELTQRWQFRFKQINRLFQNRRALGSQLKPSARPLPELRVRQLGAYRKQILLNVGQNRGQLSVREKRCRGADERVQLVDIAVRIYTVVVLSHFRTVEESRIAAIAGLCVNLHCGSQYR